MGRKKNSPSRKDERRGSPRKRRPRTADPTPASEEPLASSDASLAKESGPSSLLKGDSARDILRKITSGDPLELERRARERIDERSFLVDIERLVARGLARVSYEALRYNGFPPLEHWIERVLDRALGELLDEDRVAAKEGRPIDTDSEASFTFLTEALGVAPDLARKVAVVFNDLPEPVRRSYWALVIQGKSLEQCAADGLGTRREIESNAERAVLAMSLLADPGPAEDPKGGKR